MLNCLDYLHARKCLLFFLLFYSVSFAYRDMKATPENKIPECFD